MIARGSRLASQVGAAVVVAGLQLSAGAAAAHADSPDQDPPSASQPVKIVTLDLAVPDSPAFTMLGLSPESVTRPNTPRDLATSILNGVDRRGNLQSGIALDMAPRFLFGGDTLTYRQYTDSDVTRLLARMQVSLAATKGASEADKAVRLALGLRATLWDKGDPRMDAGLVECLNSLEIRRPTQVLSPEEQEHWVVNETARLRTKADDCRAAQRERVWNASGFSIGVAPSWNSTTGESADFDFDGAGVWASLALGLSVENASRPGERVGYGQFVVQGRYRNRERVPVKDQEGQFFEQETAGLGVRLVLGSSTRAAVLEADVARQTPKDLDPTTAYKLSLGGQLRLSTGVWISFAVGGSGGGPVAASKAAFVLSSFKWAMSREPAIK